MDSWQEFISNVITGYVTQFYNLHNVTPVTTHLWRFQSKTSPWTRLVFLVTKWIKKVYLCRNCFHYVVRITSSACQWQKQTLLVYATLMVIVASKNYIAAIAAISRLPAEVMCLTYSKTLSEKEIICTPKHVSIGPGFNSTRIMFIVFNTIYLQMEASESYKE